MFHRGCVPLVVFAPPQIAHRRRTARAVAPSLSGLLSARFHLSPVNAQTRLDLAVYGRVLATLGGSGLNSRPFPRALPTLPWRTSQVWWLPSTLSTNSPLQGTAT